MIWIVILCAVGLWLLFIFGPSLACTAAAFSRQKTVSLAENGGSPIRGTQYEPFRERILRDIDSFRKLPFERFEITSGDGVRLSGLFLRGTLNKTALLIHGYCSSPENNFSSETLELAQAGWSILLPFQRGHGESGGNRVGFGQLEAEDLLLWIGRLEQMGLGPIVLHGISMGSVACACAADRLPGSVKLCILDCGFESPREQIGRDCRKRHVPWGMMEPVVQWAARIFPGIDIGRNAGETLGKCRVPCIFLHGEKDASVPIEAGRKNFEACGNEKYFISVPDAGHATAYLALSEEQKQKIRGIIRGKTEVPKKENSHESIRDFDRRDQ